MEKHKPVNFQNMHLLLDLFYRHGGYWDINSSEECNIEIRWCPFIGNNKGGMCEEIFRKRVYDINEFYTLCVDTINQYLEEKEDPISVFY